MGSIWSLVITAPHLGYEALRFLFHTNLRYVAHHATGHDYFTLVPMIAMLLFAMLATLGYATKVERTPAWGLLGLAFGPIGFAMFIAGLAMLQNAKAIVPVRATPATRGR